MIKVYFGDEFLIVTKDKTFRELKKLILFKFKRIILDFFYFNKIIKENLLIYDYPEYNYKI